MENGIINSSNWRDSDTSQRFEKYVNKLRWNLLKISFKSNRIESIENLTRSDLSTLIKNYPLTSTTFDIS